MNLKDAAANLNQAHPEDILHPLYTLWGESLVRSGSYDDILPEYPRPQMKRTGFHPGAFFAGSPAFRSSQTAGTHGVPVVPPGTFFFHERAFPKRGKYALHSAF